MTAGDLSLGEYRSAKLDLLAGIEKQLTLIAQNTAHADVHRRSDSGRPLNPVVLGAQTARDRSVSRATGPEPEASRDAAGLREFPVRGSSSAPAIGA